MLQFTRDHGKLSLGVAISLLLVLLFEFIFVGEVEPFRGGAKLAAISVNLSLAYIASIIVYVLTVYVPERSRRLALAESIRQSKKLIEHAFEWYFSCQGDGIPSDDQIDDFFKKISLDDMHPWLNQRDDGGFTFNQFTGSGNISVFCALDLYLIKSVCFEVESLSKFSGSLHADVNEVSFKIIHSKAASWFFRYPAKTSKSHPETRHVENYAKEMAGYSRELVKTIDRIYGNV